MNIVEGRRSCYAKYHALLSFQSHKIDSSDNPEARSVLHSLFVALVLTRVQLQTRACISDRDMWHQDKSKTSQILSIELLGTRHFQTETLRGIRACLFALR